RLAVLGGVAKLFGFCLKTGSNLGVKSHQIGTKTETVARTGGFFAGGAQRRPAIFLGGVKKLPRLAAWFFLFGSARSRHASRCPSCDIMKEHTNH
ncbi:MAG: hypothetical protein ACFNZR_04005, partial [Candidatus Nanosynbacter sp.]